MISTENYRFPIDHPSYSYPPSKNPYGPKLQEFKGTVFSDMDTEVNRGRWRSSYTGRVDSQRELHVEIGCNAGHVIVEWAKANPNSAYIGIDWKFKPIFRGAGKCQRAKLSNLLLFRAHAERLSYIFGSQEIDFLYLYFPDPWPKKSQWKNRFITKTRLEEIAKIMKPSGIFHIKTDHPDYFEWILQAVEASRNIWTVLDLNRDLHRGHPAPQTLKVPEVTLFENLFIREQIPIQSLKLQIHSNQRAPCKSRLFNGPLL